MNSRAQLSLTDMQSLSPRQRREQPPDHYCPDVIQFSILGCAISQSVIGS